MSRKQTPSDFLKQIIGRPVVVKLNSGADYRGTPAFSYVFKIENFRFAGQNNQALFIWTICVTRLIKQECCVFLVLGVLACLDSYMNIALEQTEEYVNGQVYYSPVKNGARINKFWNWTWRR